MTRLTPSRSRLLASVASAILVLATTISPASAQSGSLQSAFAAAASEFGVPERVLLAVSYTLTRWEPSAAPSAAGGFGPMQLIEPDQAKGNGRGEGNQRVAARTESGASLALAATAIGVSPNRIKKDAAQNIRGGAALLALYARETVGGVPSDAAKWYGAIARYSGSDERSVAFGFADAAYTAINGGAARTLADGQRVTLAASATSPDTTTAKTLTVFDRKHTGFDCPKGLRCRFIPAAYHQNNPKDAGDYGNFDLARREVDGLDTRFIVIHDAETDYKTTIKIFQDSRSYVSAHYVLSTGGDVTQMVDNKNVGWHAGNWNVNMHAIGYEHEGFAIQGTTWYTDAMYQASAALTRHLAAEYGIPLDRGHIIGHDDIPGPTDAFARGMHWDPGPFWNWARYMELLGAPIVPTATGGNVVTIRPDFATNRPPVRDCEGGSGQLVPSQSTSFVYVYTAPSLDAPLANDPYLNTGGTECANDWGDKAVTGQQFYRAETQGDWDALWYGGNKVWIHNPGGARTVTTRGAVITPKAGLASIDIYGRAYPESESTARLTRYAMLAGQAYVAYDKVPGQYYWATTFDDLESYELRTTATEFYLIQYNHRLAFVRASDVDVVGTP
jgi:N-acetyl-anhydromuramyl-L-alanine amidase AmpD